MWPHSPWSTLSCIYSVYILLILTSHSSHSFFLILCPVCSCFLISKFNRDWVGEGRSISYCMLLILGIMIQAGVKWVLFELYTTHQHRMERYQLLYAEGFWVTGPVGQSGQPLNWKHFQVGEFSGIYEHRGLKFHSSTGKFMLFNFVFSKLSNKL